MASTFAFLVALLAASVAAFQAPINSALSRQVGLMAANVFSNSVGTAALLVAMVLMEPHALKWDHWATGLGRVPAILWTGGILGSLYMVASVLSVQRIGASGWVIAAFAGQVITGLVVDRLGLFGVPQITITPSHWIGIGLIVVGGLLAARR